MTTTTFIAGARQAWNHARSTRTRVLQAERKAKRAALVAGRPAAVAVGSARTASHGLDEATAYAVAAPGTRMRAPRWVRWTVYLLIAVYVPWTVVQRVPDLKVVPFAPLSPTWGDVWGFLNPELNIEELSPGSWVLRSLQGDQPFSAEDVWKALNPSMAFPPGWTPTGDALARYLSEHLLPAVGAASHCATTPPPQPTGPAPGATPIMAASAAPAGIVTDAGQAIARAFGEALKEDLLNVQNAAEYGRWVYGVVGGFVSTAADGFLAKQGAADPAVALASAMEGVCSTAGCVVTPPAGASTGAALARSAAVAAGFAGEDLEIAVAVAGAESGYDAAATHTNGNGSVDHGLWQINSVNTDVLALGDWRDPMVNARMAKAVFDRQGWTAWTTFDSGAYLEHMAPAAPPQGPAASGPGMPVEPIAAGSGTRWAAPALSSPTEIQVPASGGTISLPSGRDVVLKMPAVPVQRGITLQGAARNVVLVGGEVRDDGSDNDHSRAIHIKDATGTVHVEGVRFTGKGTEDVITMAVPGSTVVQLQNLYVESIAGTRAGNHGDFVQTWSGPGVLRMAGLHAEDISYQGFYMEPEKYGPPIRQIEARDIYLNGKGGSGVLMWNRGYPITASNIWIEPDGTGEATIGDWPGVQHGRPASVLTGTPGIGYAGSSGGYVSVPPGAPQAPACVAPTPVTASTTAEPGPWGGHANGKIPQAALCSPASQPGKLLRCDAAQAFDRLAAAFERDLGRPLTLTDGYRTYEGQVSCRARKGDMCAVPGTSNHGWALAGDFGSGVEDFGTPGHEWMKANAGGYGWVHPAWAQAGGSKPEPWHWEFAGQPAGII